MVYKIYCFVDETGQDTKGIRFYVAIVIVNGKDIEIVREDISKIEESSGKKSRKWGESSISARISYLNSAIRVIKNKGHIYFAKYHNTREFVALTALTLAQAIANFSDTTQTEAVIIIDGMKDKERDKTLTILKDLHIKYKKVTGKRDQSEPLLRLADSIAGLIRDGDENQDYVAKLQHNLEKYGIITKLQK